MNITIHRVTPLIFAVVVPDDYDRSMLFLRAQEYSDSPNIQFRGKSFDLFDFMKWYSQQNEGDFTYAEDWAGFNIPFQTAMDCYHDLPKKWINDYDIEFARVLKHIAKQLGNAKDKANAYIIGVDALNSRTFRHEMYHAKYFTNSDYRRLTNKWIKELSKDIYQKFRSNLIKVGYANKNFVIHNEIQAYLLGQDWNHPDFIRGIPKRRVRLLHEQFNAFLNDANVYG